MTDYMDKRKHLRYKVKWPITIYTNKGPIEGVSRNITGAGIFIHCEEMLHEDEVYRMVIRFPQREPVEVEGRLVWSNLEGFSPASTISGMGFSFVKFADKDADRLGNAVSDYRQ